MFFLKLIFLFFVTINLMANDDYIDSIALSKIKKLVQKEEEIATAYKKYLLEKGTPPSSVNTLVTQNYLPKGYSVFSPFGKEMKLSNTTSNYDSTDAIPDSIKVKTNIFDYYYSNKNRVNTKAPVSVKNGKVEIVLNYKEKFIFTNKDKITTTKSSAINKYYLDNKGVLHWYDLTGKYKYSFDKDLILDESVVILNVDGSVNTSFQTLVQEVLYAGMTILHKKDEVAQEYVVITPNNVVKLKDETKDIGKTVIQFTRRAGGMIVNGDIYTWGNNANKITGIDLENYTVNSGATGTKIPVINGLVRAKVKTYDNTIDSQNYFSSPLRPKFIDFFATVYHGTCGVTLKGELYCGGVTAGDKGSMYTYLDTQNVSNPPEMFYRDKYFNGTTNKKATKIYANNAIWLILANTNVDLDGSYKDGQIFRWGNDYAGFAGESNGSYNNKNDPTELVVKEGNSKVLFKDITYLLTIGYRKNLALANNGSVYIWGMDTYYYYGCNQTINNQKINLCVPTKVDTDKTFSSISGSLNAFVGLGHDGKYYKISQTWGSLPKVEAVSDIIKTSKYSSQYNEQDDNELIYVDFTSNGVVWVNSKNQLKGDYFTTENQSDTVFKKSVEKIKWKKIKVIEDDNGMCGIDIYNQMYCWGMQSFYRSGYADGNTFMIPVFNTNLYDSNKDYLVSEGSSNFLTNMTSGDWTTSDSKGPFFIKYPTYIGGFNYEFIFK